MGTAIPVHNFCEVYFFFFKRKEIFFLQKKGKKLEQSQSVRTDYYLVGIFVIGLFVVCCFWA